MSLIKSFSLKKKKKERKEQNVLVIYLKYLCCPGRQHILLAVLPIGNAEKNTKLTNIYRQLFTLQTSRCGPAEMHPNNGILRY